MKHSISILLVALVATFAFSTEADAQFGLGRVVSKAVSKATNKQKKTKEQLGLTEENGQVLFNGKPVDQTYKEVTVKNWQTGEMETITNPFLRGNGQPEKPITSQEIYKEEKNFQDKEMKTKIIEAFMEDEQFNDRKRAADDVLKGRKVVDIIFQFTGWMINRDKWDNIESRWIRVYVISELTNGFTCAEQCTVTNKYEGGGSYSNAFIFKVIEDYWKAANKPGFRLVDRRLVTDWEHK